MKIEKVNENQIRCTLTKEDLADRQIKLSELAYGTDKAKDLFRDMMQQAAYECGFEAEDIPIMIEAIPVSTECILLIITKVENPEELDTRFSRFSASSEEEETEEQTPSISMQGADDILDLFSQIRASHAAKDKPSDFVPLSESLGGSAKPQKKDTTPKKPVFPTVSAQPTVLSDITKLYSFTSLSDVSRVADVINGFYDGENALYRLDQGYFLFVKKSSHTPEDYNKLCNIFAEYAHQETCSPAIEAFFEEHADAILPERALQTLANL